MAGNALIGTAVSVPLTSQTGETLRDSVEMTYPGWVRLGLRKDYLPEK